MQIDRTSCRYEARPEREPEVKQEMTEIAEAHPCFGYRRLTALLKKAGRRVNHKRHHGAFHHLYARSRFGRQRAQPVENLRDIVQAAVYDLQLRDAVIGVLHALAQLGDVAAQAVGYGEPGRVVGRGIDSVAGGELLTGVVLKVGIESNIVLRI